MITIRVKRHLHKSDNTIVIQVASCLKYFVLLQDSMLESHLIYIYSFILIQSKFLLVFFSSLYIYIYVNYKLELLCM